MVFLEVFKVLEFRCVAGVCLALCYLFRISKVWSLGPGSGLLRVFSRRFLYKILGGVSGVSIRLFLQGFYAFP